MKKKQPKWFQANAAADAAESTATLPEQQPSDTKSAAQSSVDSADDNNMIATAKNDKADSTDALAAPNAANPHNKPSVTEDPVKSLHKIFFKDMHKFKAEGLYEEALACIQNIIDLQGADAELLYEAADLYFLMEDYRRAANCLKSFQNVHPQDGRGYLLQAQILLQTGKKDIALQTIERLFQQKIELTDEIEFIAMDKIIDKLKKSFKADKLFRRCPQLLAYQKKRRQMLKTQSNTAAKTKTPVSTGLPDDLALAMTPTAPETTADAPTSSPEPAAEATAPPPAALSTPAAAEPTNAEPNGLNDNTADSESDSTLKTVISNIWNMQSATSEEKSLISAADAKTVSQSILKQVLSYKKKIWLYNYLADIYRQNKQLSNGIYLLRQALLLDDEDTLLLKNLGYLLYKNQEFNAAKVALQDIAVQERDFAVLELIEHCQKH